MGVISTLNATLDEFRESLVINSVTYGVGDSDVPISKGPPHQAEYKSSWELIPTKRLLSRKKYIVGENWTNFTLLSLTNRGIIARDMENPKGKFPTSFDTYQVVEKNDMVFCLFDVEETPRTIALSNLKGMITGAYDVTEVNHNFVLPEYLELYFLAMDSKKCLKPYYTGLRNVIRWDNFGQILIPVPPKSEQRQILDYVEGKIQYLNQLSDTAL